MIIFHTFWCYYKTYYFKNSLDPMDWSMSGLSVHHSLPDFAQTHVLWVSDAIQPSHPLSPPFLALNLSQHHGLFQSQLFTSGDQKYWSFSFSISSSSEYSGLIFFLRLTGLISLLSKGLSRIFSNTTVWKHQFFGTQPSKGPTLTSIHNAGTKIILAPKKCNCVSS